MREGLGPDRLIMIDCGWNVKWDVMTAVRRVQAFEEHGLHWIEEPLLEWDPEGYANLRSKTTSLIAYGEKEWDLAGLDRVLATGTVDVVGIDPGRAEGITGFKKATERIEHVRRQSNAHAWSSAICTAASLAVSFSTSAKLFSSSPSQPHAAPGGAIRHVQGWVYPPIRPGLGIEVMRSSTGTAAEGTTAWSVGAGLEGRAHRHGRCRRHRTGRGGRSRRPARVMAVTRAGRVDEVVDDLEGGGHVDVALDLADLTGHAALIERARARWGTPRAGQPGAVLRRRASIDDITEADWDSQHDVNLKACFFLCRTAGNAMVEQGKGGRIIVFSSQGWWTGGYGGSVVYASTKGGVTSMCRGLARTYGAH
jgi:hypothetical protein